MPTLFDPVSFGDISLKNRIVMAPLTRGRAGPSRIPNALMATYYAQRASAGLIVSEATAISKMGYGFHGAPAMYDPTHVEGWKTVTKAVHEHGGKIVLQLWHMGRVSHPENLNGEQPVAPSAVAAEGQANTPHGRLPYVTPRALTLSEISDTVDDYARCARQAIEAGFDGVEIHAAHGYLLDQFIRDCSNKRTDQYGGPIENRIRIVRDVTEAVTDAIGAHRTGIRISPTTAHNSMSDSDPLATFVTLVQELNSYDLAFLHVREDLPEKNGPEKNGAPIFVTPSLREIYKGHLIVNGGYDKDRAVLALARGEADAVAFGSAYIANPDLVARFQSNASLNQLDQASMYMGDAKGYTDYPML